MSGLLESNQLREDLNKLWSKYETTKLKYKKVELLEQ